MMRKKGVAGFEVVLMIVSVFAFAFMFAEPVGAQTEMSEASFCCERTDDGAWCINAEESQCDSNFNAAPTSCETTSYCRLGTCYESEEGICMENTPQRVCNDNGGTWDAREIEQVPQCQLGCCIIADQAAFVPLVRCKRLSTLFGVSIDYRTDINNEVSCIAEAQAQDVGACVYEKEFERTCEFTTRGDCGAGTRVEAVNGTNISLSSQRTFYEDFLCSAEELNTACAKEVSTSCYQGDVYWMDSCGNRENVYSSNMAKSWNAGKVVDASGVCNANDGSDVNCGNCDYLLGSRCAKYDKYLGGPEYGENYCQKTECVDRNGDERINGESWCVYDDGVGNGGDRVGSRYFREICVDGKVRVEPCADFRNEICLESSIETDAGDFGTAACRVNRWQDCVAQEDEDDCNNIDKRDCLWLNPVTGMVLGGGQASSGEGFSNPSVGKTAFSNPTGSVIAPITGAFLGIGGDDEEEQQEATVTNRPKGVCVPNFPPGLKFWEESSAQQICGLANAKCTVVYEKGLIGGSKVVEGGECLSEDWALSANRVCAGLGDCGGYVNYQGAYSDDGYKWNEEGEDKEFSPNMINIISAGFTGMIIGMMTGRITEEAQALKIAARPEVVEAQGLVTSTSAGVATAQTAVANAQLGLTNAQTIATAQTVGTPAAGLAAENVIVAQNSLAAANADLAIAQTASTEAVKGLAAVTPATGGSSWLSSTFGGEGILTGGGWDAAFTGAEWAALAYMAGQMIGPMIGFDKKNTKALSTAMAAGFGTYGALSTWKVTADMWLGTGWVGLGIGVVVFLAMYKKSETKTVTFNCMPWQAPTGGNVCEECNDADLPCSEYRCKSLGQNCELVNKGTSDEKCVNVNPRDVDPPVIKPNYEKLTKGYKYANVKLSPPGPGFNIVNLDTDDGCLKAFSPLEFGIDVDEPAQCKIDFNHTEKFDEMVAFIGGKNLYSYNHTEKFSLPSAEAMKNASMVLENGKDLTFFIRCKDKNGNENGAEYAVNFCVDPTPDNTAPKIEATSILNGGCVAENQDTAGVMFYVNEPSNCRWSPQDQDYDLMQNAMSCSSELHQANAMQLLGCSAELTGISRDDTKFYVRCKDQPGADENDRNENKESFEFSLRGSTGLKMKDLQPNETLFGAVSPMPIELKVKTLFGCNDGQAICKYSTTGNSGDYIQFFDTNTEDGIHTQRLDLISGEHEYFVQCIDEGGNLVEDKAIFNLDIDINAPVVARIYEEDNMLKIVTVRNSECSYTFDNCDFSFEEGTEMPYSNSSVHVAEWNEEKTYYIKCRDEFKNEDADCSVIVRPSRNFL